MNSTWIKGMVGVAVLAALAGCSTSSTPKVDEKFGQAVNMAKAQQTINPEASQNRSMVRGIDGEAANAVMDRYHKAYESPTPAPSGSVGGSVGGSGSTLK